MPYNLWFPEQPTEEELMLYEKYEVLKKKKKQVLEHTEAINKVAEPPQESPSKLPPAIAKERAKKLVLTGKVYLPPKQKQEKTTFKRPNLFEKKMPSSSNLMTESKVGVTAASVGSNTAAFSNFRNGGGWSTHLESGGTAETFLNTKGYIFQEEGGSMPIPKLNASSPNIPKRGPAIYVSVKEHALSESMLRIVFGKFGKIVGIKITYPGVAFVTFRTVEDADRAITEMNGAFHNGVEYGVEFAWRQPQFGMTSNHGNHRAERNLDFQRQLVVYEDEDNMG